MAFANGIIFKKKRGSAVVAFPLFISQSGAAPPRITCGAGQRCGSKLDRDGLHFSVVLDGVFAHFAAPARLLEAAERQRRVVHVVRVFLAEKPTISSHIT